MMVTLKCGCEVSCYVWESGSWGGCCCGECYNSWGNEYTIEDAVMETTCTEHSK